MNRGAKRDPQELLRRAREQNGAALGRLLEMYRGYLTRQVRAQLGRQLQGKVDPADLVQETFLKAYQDFAQFRGQTSREWIGWLRQVLATTLAMLVRHYCGTQRRAVHLECELAYERDQPSHLLDRGLMDHSSSPSELAARREQTVLLVNALERLPQDYRAVIFLRHMEGLTFPEVARRLDRSLDSVKKLWVRALLQLRRALERD